MKKQRLAQLPDRGLNPNARSFPQRQTGSVTAAVSRLRAGDKDSDNGGAYQPQPLQQHQELVSQYKTALAELVFNSKPIITNLTIIAGENVHAAKAIAGTICNHIVEVPSEQKLPSLYLLDSIVKNIGSHYIKHFANQLPEVFCKAYRQVDSSVKSSMKHLFGTWKGVFPPTTLHVIGKELGFTPVNNGSSSGPAISRSDSQPQPPPHSIHVNPKYLERQRLQQSSRTKGTVNDVSGDIDISMEDAGVSHRAASISTTRRLTEPLLKGNGPRREKLSDPRLGKNIATASRESDNDSDPSRILGMGISKTNGKNVEQGREKPMFGAGNSVSDTVSSQRNNFCIKRRLSSTPNVKSVTTDVHPATKQNVLTSSSGISSSSTNSEEEEEFMWDTHSRLSEHDTTNITSNSNDDFFTSDVPAKLESESRLLRPPSTHDNGSRFDGETDADYFSIEKGQNAYGQWRSSSQHLEKSIRSGVMKVTPGSAAGQSSTIGLPFTDGISSLGRKVIQPLMGSSAVGLPGLGMLRSSVSGSVGSLNQQGFQSLGAETRKRKHSSSFPANQHLEYKNMADHDSYPSSDYLSRHDLEASQELHNTSTAESLITLPSSTQCNLQDSPASSVPSHHMNRHTSISHPELSDETKKQLLSLVSRFGPSSSTSNESGHLNSHVTETSGQSSVSDLLAAVTKSGVLSNNLYDQRFESKLQQKSRSSVQTPLSSGQHSSLFASSEPNIVPASLLIPGSDKSSTQKKIEPPSTLPGSELMQASDVDSKATPPISNLLDSLVAKGLIPGLKRDSPSLMPTERQSTLPEKNQGSFTTAMPLEYVQTLSDLPVVSTIDKHLLPVPTPKASATLTLPSTIEVENLIGFQFRPDKMREFHSAVIDSLYDGLPHKCSRCHLHLKLKEQLDRHLKWHGEKELEPSSADQLSRGWLAYSDDWLAANSGLLESNSIVSTEEFGRTTEVEPTVIADENQCACILCGELFEDYFSLEKNQWMFKEAVCMSIPFADGDRGTTDDTVKGPIVHASCMTENTLDDLGLANGVKMEKDV